MLRQPVTQVFLTNVAVVRYRVKNKKFELACYPNKVLDWRNGLEKDLGNVLQIDEIFTNVAQGIHANQKELSKTFGSKDREEVIQTIPSKGELQVNELERKSQQNNTLRDIANIVAEKCVDAESGRSIPVSRILKGMEEIHYSVSLSQSPKKQALNLIRLLKDRLGLAKARMTVQVNVPQEHEEKVKANLGKFEVISENEVEGKKRLLYNIEPEYYRSFSDFIKKEKLTEDVTIEIIEHRVRQLITSELPTREERKERKPQEVEVQPLLKKEVSKSFKCTTCPEAVFEDLTDHRTHFKSDWHKYNIKRKIREMTLICEAEFSLLDRGLVEDFLASKHI